MPATTRRTFTWNAYESALSSGIDGVTSTITLDSVFGLREPEGYLVLDPDDATGREYIKYASIVGNTLQGVIRGLAGGNTNQSHASGATVRAVPMHQHYDDLWDTAEELIAEDANHAASSNPHASAGYITEAAGDLRYLQLSGGGMSGPIDMQSSKIIGLGDPTVDGDAMNKLAHDTDVANNLALYLPLTGGVMTGDIAMGGNSITNLKNPPTLSGEATRKGYVDTEINGAINTHEADASNPHSAAYVPKTGGIFSGVVTFSSGLDANGVVLAPRFSAENPGTVGQPVFSWDSEQTTGLYLPAAGDLRFAVLGVLRFRLTDQLTSIASTRLQVPSLNDDALPGFYFAGDVDTGIAHTANTMKFSTGGTSRLALVNSINHTINDGPLRAIHTGSGAPDVGLGVNGDIYCDVS